jgi:methylisocitrate lyase
MQTRAELYDFLDYHSYEQKLDELFAKEQTNDKAGAL